MIDKQIGSYSIDDVEMLVKDVSNVVEEKDELIVDGRHYSETLPFELKMEKENIEAFHFSLDKNKKKIATAVGVVAELLMKKVDGEIILASIIRAGLPFGILIKRYINKVSDRKVSHYGISIIRGKGFDSNALNYIINKHNTCDIQFVDGWTGKGAVTKQIIDGCTSFNREYNKRVIANLAVVSDIAYCADTYGTREDFLMPTACLSATGTGLLSRTVHNAKIIEDKDFHGVKVYNEFMGEDLSNYLLDTLSSMFDLVKNDIQTKLNEMQMIGRTQTWIGWEEIERMAHELGIKDLNVIKPGICEATKALLNRNTELLLVNNVDKEELEYLEYLCHRFSISIKKDSSMKYSCCAITKKK